MTGACVAGGVLQILLFFFGPPGYRWYLERRIPIWVYAVSFCVAALVPLFLHARYLSRFGRGLRGVWAFISIVYFSLLVAAWTGHVARSVIAGIWPLYMTAVVGLACFFLHRTWCIEAASYRKYTSMRAYTKAVLAGGACLIAWPIAAALCQRAVTREADNVAHDLEQGLESSVDAALRIAEQRLPEPDSHVLLDLSPALRATVGRFQATRDQQNQIIGELEHCVKVLRKAAAVSSGGVLNLPQPPLPGWRFDRPESSGIKRMLENVRDAAKALGDKLLREGAFEAMVQFADWCSSWSAPPSACDTVSSGLDAAARDPGSVLAADLPFLFNLRLDSRTPEQMLEGRGVALQRLPGPQGLHVYGISRRARKMLYEARISRYDYGLLRVSIKLPDLSPAARASILQRYRRYPPPVRTRRNCTIWDAGGDAFIAAPDQGRSETLELLFVSRQTIRTWLHAGGNREAVMPAACWATRVVQRKVHN